MDWMVLPSLIQVQGYSIGFQLHIAWPEHGLDDSTIFDSSAGLYSYIAQSWPEHELDGFTIFDSSAGL